MRSVRAQLSGFTSRKAGALRVRSRPFHSGFSLPSTKAVTRVTAPGLYVSWTRTWATFTARPNSTSSHSTPASAWWDAQAAVLSPACSTSGAPVACIADQPAPAPPVDTGLGRASLGAARRSARSAREPNT